MNNFSYPFKISAALDIKSLCASISVCPALTATHMDDWVTQAVLVSGQWRYRQRPTSYKHSVPWRLPWDPCSLQRAVKYYERDTWSLWSWRCSQFAYPYYRDSNILTFFFQMENWKHRSWDFSEGASPRFAPCRLAKIMRWTYVFFPHSSVHLPLGWHSRRFSMGPSWSFQVRDLTEVTYILSSPWRSRSLVSEISDLTPGGHTVQGRGANCSLFSTCLPAYNLPSSRNQ